VGGKQGLAKLATDAQAGASAPQPAKELQAAA